MRIYIVALLFITTIVASIGMSRLFYTYFQSQEVSNAQGRLSLYQASLTSELERFSNLTYVLARHPLVLKTSQGGDKKSLNVLLQDFAEKTDVDAIYVMNRDGVTISASNATQQNSFIGQNYSFRPYFKAALAGQHGRFYAIGATTGLPGYFITDAVVNQNQQVVGVIAIKINLSNLQDSWVNSGEQVLMSNSDGVVLLTSNQQWRYRVLQPLTEKQRMEIEATKQFSGESLLPLEWQHTGPGKVIIDDRERLHLMNNNLPHQWQLHYFFSDTRAKALGWFVTTVFLIIIAIIVVLYQIQRQRQATFALRRSEQKEAELRQINSRLEMEIIERHNAEKKLKQTKDELERTCRLAALGRLSAIVTHELGQPIAAMRNHLVADEISQGKSTKLTANISALVSRMEGITRQLKFFAGKEEKDFDYVDIYLAMQNVIKLVQPNIEKADANIYLQAPAQTLIAHGNKLRIEQVMTNILRNAIDAVEGGSVRNITVTMGEANLSAWFEVVDTGHGIGDATLLDLQAPFFSTRESGHGMGLGLAISADIIKDHQGVMSAKNHDLGGAVFRVEIPTKETYKE